MDAENFREYLSDPSLLYQVPYEELKSLALEYPYNPHLRWLLLQKSRMDHRPDVRRALEKAAVYSIDRRALYRFVQRPYDKTETPLFVFTEDYLELKDLSIIREELPATAEPVAAERPVFTEPVAVQRDIPVPSTPEDEEEEHLFDFSPLPPAEVTPAAPLLSGDTPVEEQVAESWTTAQPVSDEPLATTPEIAEETPQMEARSAVEGEAAAQENVPAEESAVEIAAYPIADEPLATPEIAEEAPEMAARSTVEEDIVEQENVPADEPVAEEPVTATEIPQQEAPKVSEEDLQEYQDTLAAADVVLEKAARMTSSAPMPKRSFKSWAAPVPAPVQEAPPAAPKPVPKPEKKTKKPDAVAEIARQSVLENEALATETLADLLAAQQQYDKAAKMYERLILKFPEKSVYFAAKIEKLKKK